MANLIKCSISTLGIEISTDSVKRQHALVKAVYYDVGEIVSSQTVPRIRMSWVHITKRVIFPKCTPLFPPNDVGLLVRASS